MSKNSITQLLALIKVKNYSVPEGFDEASVSYLEVIYNGIGAEWMNPKVRNMLAKFLKCLEPDALIHDFEFSGSNKSYFAFTKANLRLAYNAFKGGHALAGTAAAILCQVFGWSAWMDGKETMAYYYYLKGK
jgi:hypothetical protein